MCLGVTQGVVSPTWVLEMSWLVQRGLELILSGYVDQQGSAQPTEPYDFSIIAAFTHSDKVVWRFAGCKLPKSCLA